VNLFSALNSGKLLYVYVKFKTRTRRGHGLVFRFDEGLHVWRKLDFRVSGGVAQQPRDCLLISCVCCVVQTPRCFVDSQFRALENQWKRWKQCTSGSVGSTYTAFQQQ
jgi:hypothetical protein